MTTNTAGTTARELPTQQVHYLRKTVNYSDTGLTTGVKMPNPLPSGAQILSCLVNVKTAFATGTPILTVGTNSATFNDIVAAADVTETSTGSTTVLRGADVDIAADTDVYIMVANGGGTTSAGKAVVVISYVPDNDA